MKQQRRGPGRPSKPQSDKPMSNDLLPRQWEQLQNEAAAMGVSGVSAAHLHREIIGLFLKVSERSKPGTGLASMLEAIDWFYAAKERAEGLVPAPEQDREFETMIKGATKSNRKNHKKEKVT